MMYIPYGRQWVQEEDIEAVAETLRSDWLTQGPKVEEFEKEVAAYCGARYGVAVCNGTAALHAVYAAAGIGPGDEVIVPTLTFAATANAAVYCGGIPVFADILEDTLCVDPTEIERKITKRTKAIAPVDFAGHPAEYDEILHIANTHKLLTIEDAAHALGSEYRGKKIGSLADMSIFSFHPVKTITTGEGGMVLTNSKEFYEKLKKFRHHGIVKKPEHGPWYYDIEQPGYNLRITDMQCALGLSQLKKLNRFVERRRAIVERYNAAFGNFAGATLLKERAYAKSAWHIYVIQVENRKQVFGALRDQGIGVQVHYMPVHLHPFYRQQFGCKKGDFPKAERYYERTITLPLFPKMADNEVEYVIQTVQEVIPRYQ